MGGEPFAVSEEIRKHAFTRDRNKEMKVVGHDYKGVNPYAMLSATIVNALQEYLAELWFAENRNAPVYVASNEAEPRIGFFVPARHGVPRAEARGLNIFL